MPDIIRLPAQLPGRPVGIVEIERHQPGDTRDNGPDQNQGALDDLVGLRADHRPGDDGDKIPVRSQLQRKVTEHGLLTLIRKGGPAGFLR